MVFETFADIVAKSITAFAGVIPIAKAWRNYQLNHLLEEKDKISKSDWLKFCKMFKKYIKEHPELGISIIEAQKKGEATKYQKKEK